MSSIHVQSLPVQQTALPSTPSIRIHNPSLDCLPLSTIPEAPLATPPPTPNLQAKGRSLVRKGRIQRRDSLRRQARKHSALPDHMVEEVLQTKFTKEKERDKKKKEAQRREATEMGSSHRRLSSVSSDSSSPEASPTMSPTSSRSKSKPKSKDSSWTDVTDPEERRRIQNRIAQRKFRMSSSTLTLHLTY